MIMKVVDGLGNTLYAKGVIGYVSVDLVVFPYKIPSGHTRVKYLALGID
jgi:hypothetical protein